MRTQTSRATAIRAERILKAITRKSRLKRAEQKQKNIFTNNRALAQRQRQEQKEERKRLEEHQRRIHEEEQRWQRIESLKRELQRSTNPYRQSQIIQEIKKERHALKRANSLTMQTIKMGF